MQPWIGVGMVCAGAGMAFLATRLPGGGKHPARGDAGAVLLLTGIVMLFFWPVLCAGYSFPRGGGDLWGQLYPVWAFVAAQVRRGIFPLWNPLLEAGDPILSEGQFGLFNPLNWPLFLVSPPPRAMVLWRGMMGLLIAGVGMYLYLTRSPHLRLTRPAGLVGATAYMLSDPFVTHLGHPQINDVMAWFPWSLLGLDWALAAPSWGQAALGGVPLALMVLGGHGQAALYGLLAAGLYGVGTCLLPAGRGRELPLHARMIRMALAALVGFALSAPMTLPGMERLPWTVRTLMPRELRRGYEFIPPLLMDSLAPCFHGCRVEQIWMRMDRVEKAYIGAVALYLALWGVVTRFKRALPWLGLGVLALLFALGYQAPLYPLVADWPFFYDSWKTGRAIFVTAFAMAILAGLGSDALIQAVRTRSRRWHLLFPLLLAGFGVALWVATPGLLAPVPPGQAQQIALTGLRVASLLAGGLAVLVGVWLRWRERSALAGVLLLLVAELVATGALTEAEPAIPFADPGHEAALAFLKRDPGWFRVDTDLSSRQIWSPELMQVQGFETVQGSGNPLALYPFEQFYWAQPSRVSPGYRLLGVKYIVVSKGQPPGGDGIWPVFIEDEAVDIHLNTLALPRVWLVYRTEPVADFEAAFRRVQSADFRPEEVAVVENGPRLEGKGQGRIDVVRYSPNEVILAVRTDAPALLVLSDVYYPGWQAWVDRTAVPIYRADVTFRGVLVPPGEHVVRMRFLPRTFLTGAALAAVTMALLLLGNRRRLPRLCIVRRGR
ncbi:MAG: YfhO family protein [Anaerolineae bacterium]|nr:YfhO family protein [Anaerolineae bacterium]